MNGSAHSLSQAINDIGAQRAAPFEKVAQYQYVETGVGGNSLQRLSAAVDGTSQMSTYGILGGRLRETLTTLPKLRHFCRNSLAVLAQLFSQFSGNRFHFGHICLVEVVRHTCAPSLISQIYYREAGERCQFNVMTATSWLTCSIGSHTCRL